MGIKIIAKNKRASFDYALHDKYEAGLALMGTEIKSLRLGKVTMQEAFVKIDENTLEAWLYNMNIPQYDHGNRFNHDEDRKRKLLLHKLEIEKILHAQKTQNFSIIPTIIYFKESRVKIEIALGKGKKHYDKRADEAKKDVQRKLQRGSFE